MAKTTVTSTSEKSTSSTKSQETGKSTSLTRGVLDEKLLETIMSGLTAQMTQEEIRKFAQSLLMPQAEAEREAARQAHETTKLAKGQEMENLAAELERAISEQNGAYRRSMADVETAAIRRGMGRSSYTLDRLAQQGDALAQAVKALTEENERRSDQIQRQITQSAQQSAQTQARIDRDYETRLAAKIEELTQEQSKQRDRDYLTAISAAMGRETVGTSETTGESRTDTSSQKTTVTTSSGKSSGGSSGKASGETGKTTAQKKGDFEVDIFKKK